MTEQIRPTAGRHGVRRSMVALLAVTTMATACQTPEPAPGAPTTTSIPAGGPTWFDPTFGENGVLRVDGDPSLTGFSFFSTATVRSQGLYLFFNASKANSTISRVIRLTPDGDVDASFADDGALDASSLTVPAVDDSGRVVFAVPTMFATPQTPTLSRFLADGSPDPLVTDRSLGLPAGFAVASMASGPGGVTVVALTRSTPSETAVVALADDGTVTRLLPDSSAGVRQPVVLGFAPDGDVFLAGKRPLDGPQIGEESFVVKARLDGAIDNAWGDSGELVMSPDLGTWTAAVLSDGSLLTSSVPSTIPASSLRLIRHDPSGVVVSTGGFAGGSMLFPGVTSNAVRALSAGGFAVNVSVSPDDYRFELFNNDGTARTPSAGGAAGQVLVGTAPQGSGPGLIDGGSQLFVVARELTQRGQEALIWRFSNVL